MGGKFRWLILALCIATSQQSLAQYEGRDINITVEYRGRDSAGDGGNAGAGNAGGSGSGSAGSGTNSGASTIVSAPPSPMRTSRVTIGGQTFTVSKDAEDRLRAFLEEWNRDGRVGMWVSAAAVLATLWDLVSLESSHPLLTEYDAMLRVGDDDLLDGTELADRLSAPGTWAKAWRALGAKGCEAEIGRAAVMRRSREAAMWQKLRDLFMNPQRYQNGGIKFDKVQKDVKVRPLAGEQYRGIASGLPPMNANDKIQFAAMLGHLTLVPSARDFVFSTSAVLTDLNTALPATMDRRDRLLLNLAFRSLSASARDFHFRALRANQQNPATNRDFWRAMEANLWSDDAWQSGLAVPYISLVPDPGEFADDLPAQSDLVTDTFVSNQLR